MRKIIALTLLLIGLLILAESCSVQHHKPKRPCRGGNWNGNLMNTRIW